MIPVELILEGIYSYRERTRIDFQPLLEAHLFGIFGSVGSGKSSLLDAITFALYGQVERMSKQDKLAANLFNLEADKAFIQFTFDSLVDGRRYQCVASGKRKKQGPVLQRESFAVEGDNLVPISDAELETAIGLSYDHFSRTVIVPQGQFQAFLQLTDAERTTMLQHLFHLHRFDLGGRLRSLFGQTRSVEQHLAGRLATLEQMLLTPLSQLQLERTAIESRKSTMTTLVKNRQAELDGLRQVHQHWLSLHKLINERSGLQEQLDRQHENTLKAQAEALTAQQRATEIPRKEELRKSLQICVEMVRCHDQMTVIKQKVDSGKAELSPLHASIEQSGQTLTEINQKIDLLLTQQLPQEQIRVWSEWQFNWDQLELNRVQLEVQGKQWKQTLTELKKQLSAYWHNQSRLKALADDPPSEPAQLLTRELNRLEADLVRVEQQIHDVRLSAGLRPYSQLLASGEPCPLCGSTDHPDPISGDADEDLFQPLERNREIGRNAIRQMQQDMAEIKRLTDQIGLQQERLEALRQTYQELLQQQKISSTQLEKWHMTREDLSRQISTQTGLGGQIATEQRQQQQIHSARHQLETTLQQRHGELQHLEAELVALQSRYVTLNEQAGGTEQLESYLLLSIVDLNARMTALEEEIKSITRKNEASFLALQQASDLLKQIQTRHDHTAEQETAIRALFQDAIVQLFDRFPSLKNIIIPDHIEERITDLTSLLDEDLQTVQTLSNELAVQDRLIEETVLRSKEATQLREELQQITHKLNNLRTLETLFRGKGMVDFAASRYLRQILEHANQRFYRMTRHKLRLELGDGNRIMVRDYYHGGALRLVKTLSGGQLFQAALALALSMAEQIRQHRHGDRDFFFLDEGFGTQDRESLMIVLDTLKALRDENRSVGIISHVDELQQEVNAFLKIRLDPIRGSLITTSHE